jgi:2-methylcitrate dehydratase PrpD
VTTRPRAAERSTVLEPVAEFAASLDLATVPAEVLEKAKVTLLHDLTVALAGYRPGEPAARLAEEYARSRPGDGARLLVSGAHVTVDAATLATGALIHARTQDDSQLSAQMHLGCTTLPALLALGDRDDRSGADFLAAMIAGYEVATVIGRGASRAAVDRGFRPASIFGSFAAAAACSRLLGLDAAGFVSALALAASFGGGVNQTWASGGQEWQYQVGQASRNGLTAALLASQGVAGARDALEGPAGFYRAFTDATRAGSQPAGDLGRHWNLLDVSFKSHPVCAINQNPVDVALRLIRGHPVALDAIDQISVYLPPHQARYPAIDNTGPFGSAGDALMSIQFCLAVALSRGAVRVVDLESELSAAETALVERCQVVGDPALTENSCRLVMVVGGAEISDGHTASAADGSWGRHRARELVDGLLPDMPIDRGQADLLAEVCLAFEQRQVRQLIDATLPAAVRNKM